MRDFPNLYFERAIYMDQMKKHTKGETYSVHGGGGVLIGKCNRKQKPARPTQMGAQYDNTLSSYGLRHRVSNGR
jgi:hypothetical protein